MKTSKCTLVYTKYWTINSEINSVIDAAANVPIFRSSLGSLKVFFPFIGFCVVHVYFWHDVIKLEQKNRIENKLALNVGKKEQKTNKKTEL